MAEAWIQLFCPNCEESWEENLNTLSPPSSEFTCDHCEATRPMAEFMRTARDLEILEEFHGE